MVRPDYAGGGFLNLISSLVEAHGGAPRHVPLELLPPREVAEARNLVFVIVDGLGDRYLAQTGSKGALARHRRGAMTSVFPSTTASAITTSYTGAAPVEHGITGWFTYFGEAACVGSPLQFNRRGDKAPLGAAPPTIFRAPSLFDTLASRGIVVSYRPIIDSVYNRHHCGRAERLAYDDLRGFIEQTVAAVTTGPEHKFIYAYWPQFDARAHPHGVASAEARREFDAVDAAFDELLQRLAGTDSIVVLTADHGFMDSPVENALDLPPALAPLLRFPLCGERRIAFCHVHDRKRFIEEAEIAFKDRARVLPSETLAQEGWFGTGDAHPDFAERIGDVALVMAGPYTVKDWLAGEPRHLHIGNHGGASEEEMMIPLVVAKA